MTNNIDIDLATDDQQLMQDLVQGNSFALEQIYKRYRIVLKSIVQQVLHNDAESEDVLQDVFIQVWERATTYSAEKGKLLSWLATMARRRAIDRVRQHTAYHRATDRFEAEIGTSGIGPDAGQSVEEQAQTEDLRELMSQQISLLPEHQQNAIRMSFYEGHSQREISAMTGIPLGTVKTRIELGIKKLSTAIRQIQHQIL